MVNVKRLNYTLVLKIMLPILAGLLTFTYFCRANVYGQGTSVEIFESVQNPYHVLVEILPHPPMIGTAHFTIKLGNSQTGLPIETAAVTIIANDSNGHPTYQVMALNTPSTPSTYRANITFYDPGKWTLKLEVSTKKLGETSFVVPLLLQGQPLESGIAGTLLWISIILLITSGAGYVWYSSKKTSLMKRA